MSEWKPCPFCGETDIRCNTHHAERYAPEPYVYSMCCYNCGATFPNRYKRELLLDAWNRRASPPQPDALKLAENEREQIASSLFRRMEHLDPTEDGNLDADDLGWSALTCHQREFYRLCVTEVVEALAAIQAAQEEQAEQAEQVERR